jgi:hypothetical protein
MYVASQSAVLSLVSDFVQSIGEVWDWVGGSIYTQRPCFRVPSTVYQIKIAF